MRTIDGTLEALTVFLCAGLMTLSCTRREPDETWIDDRKPASEEAVPATQSASSFSTSEMAVGVPSVVREAQDHLSRKGYAVSVNGVLDISTVDAIRNFQRDSGLPTTGSLTAETLNALQIKAPAAMDNTRSPASVPEHEPIN